MTLALALLAKIPDAPPPTDRSLFLFTLALVVGLLAAAAFLAHRAPAVTIALLGAMLTGLSGFVLTDPSGPHWVPARVAVWASVGLTAAGLAGATLTRADPANLRFLARTGWVTLAVAPVGAVLIVRTMAPACPYESHITRYCFYGDTDLFGGWSAAIMTMFFLDGVALALLFWISAWQGRPER